MNNVQVAFAILGFGLALLLLSGCHDAELAAYVKAERERPGRVTCYQSGAPIFDAETVGHIDGNGKGTYWFEQRNGQVTTVSGDCVATYTTCIRYGCPKETP